MTVTAQALRDYAAQLDEEARNLEARFTEGGLTPDQLRAATLATIDPRKTAAHRLRHAANALQAIPPMGFIS